MIGFNQPFKKIMEHAEDILTRQLEGDRSQYEAKVESPIEAAFIAAFMVTLRRDGFLADVKWEAQHKIGAYRVDFFIRAYGRTLVVECDGHDFHERTKKQAAKDRSRDRQLQQLGHTVFRFTGSEIWANPMDCAEQVISWAIQCMFEEEIAR